PAVTRGAVAKATDTGETVTDIEDEVACARHSRDHCADGQHWDGIIFDIDGCHRTSPGHYRRGTLFRSHPWAPSLGTEHREEYLAEVLGRTFQNHSAVQHSTVLVAFVSGN